MLSEEAVDKKGNRHWIITSGPSVEPVTLDEIKTFARIDGTDEDDLLTNFIKASRKRVELFLGQSLITQTIRLTMDTWEVREIELPMSPLISVTSVETLDEDGVATTYSSSYYYVMTDPIPGKLVIKKDYTLPENTDRDYGGFRITYTAGYGATASSVPDEIKEAIKIDVTKLYETRDFQTPLPPPAKIYLDSFRTDRGIKY